jgi:hypothetical protein
MLKEQSMRHQRQRRHPQVLRDGRQHLQRRDFADDPRQGQERQGAVVGNRERRGHAVGPHTARNSARRSRRSWCRKEAARYRRGRWNSRQAWPSAAPAVPSGRRRPSRTRRSAYPSRRRGHRPPRPRRAPHRSKTVRPLSRIQDSGRMCGNSSTSRIDGEFVYSMTSRSTPNPSPAVGGMPYSSART